MQSEQVEDGGGLKASGKREIQNKLLDRIWN